MAQVQGQQEEVLNGGGTGENQLVPTSLYVGELDLNVTDSQLYDLFNQVGQVMSVRVCKDSTTRRSLGYGYVNFSNPEDAERALEVLNFTPLNGKPLRIMYSRRDPTIRKSGSGNIFIKNLEKSIDHKDLHDTFSAFGNILSCKVATDASGQSRGYGFVQYETEEAAQEAIEKLNGMLLNDKQVFVEHFLRKQERETVAEKMRYTNVFVKNLSEETAEDVLQKVFAEFGVITSVAVMRDGDGKSKCFGFINFENSEDAANAVEALNGKKFDDKEWYVGKAQKKSEREQELKLRFEQSANEVADKSHGLNLYIKNLDDSIYDDKLSKLFSPFGTITSCKVMRDNSGISRGSGFVSFSAPEEASSALLEMNGKMVVRKPLYVALAQRKEERRSKLQAQFSQMLPVTITASAPPRMPLYPPGGLGLGQQPFLDTIPPQPGYGYGQQVVPGMRPVGSPIPNFFGPMAPQGSRPNGRHPPVFSAPQGQRPQMFPRGHAIPDASMLGALASVIANASPADQRMILGENLYPLVEQLESEAAAKVTGMLLDLDQTEILQLIESPEALKAKVSEAMEVLTTNVSHQYQQANNSVADHLASLSLNNGLFS